METKSKKMDFLKNTKIVEVLAIVALALRAIYYLMYYTGVAYFAVKNLIYAVLYLAPFVLMVIYLFKFHKEGKADAFLPIIFGFLAVPRFLNLFGGLDKYSALVNALIVLALVIALFGSIKRFYNRWLVIVPVALCLLVELLTFVSEVSYIFKVLQYGYPPLYILLQVVFYLSKLLFLIAIILFYFNGANVESAPKTAVEEKDLTDVENELLLLREEFESGLITDEEYSEKKSALLERL
jgi:uncharacterized membrane protein